ncbi:hypothetical protein [Otariodibacter oris]|uniref:Transferrin binding protein n=1 Tax=Otariodibacter oris TaxID=1032623 RepID=A0A420XJ99_9PAST|nr:hypothetical protein [Otariodibacter oris]QGM80522.1 hypothetical protein A6A10_03465 [Otariodibacter oris]RKR77326.1 hypothetical protein DES31_0655 [Otariodibacter oris]
MKSLKLNIVLATIASFTIVGCGSSGGSSNKLQILPDDFEITDSDKFEAMKISIENKTDPNVKEGVVKAYSLYYLDSTNSPEYKTLVKEKPTKDINKNNIQGTFEGELSFQLSKNDSSDITSANTKVTFNVNNGKISGENQKNEIIYVKFGDADIQENLTFSGGKFTYTEHGASTPITSTYNGSFAGPKAENVVGKIEKSSETNGSQILGGAFVAEKQQ